MKTLLAIFFLLIAIASHAQELTWADSIDQGLYEKPKKERKRIKLEINLPTPPANHIYNGLVVNFTKNPAYAGYEEMHNFNLAYFHKFPGLYYSDSDGTHFLSPRGYWASYEFSIGKKKKSHFGLNFQQTKRGYHKETNLGLTYAFSAKIGSFQKLRLGISTKYFQYRAEWDKLTFGEMIDPRYGFIYESVEAAPRLGNGYLDFNAGLWYELGPLHIGFSALTLTQPNEGIFGLSVKPRVLVFNPQYHLVVNDRLIISPYYRGTYSSSNTHTPGLNFSLWNKYLIGVSYTNLNNAQLQLAYSFKGFRFFVQGGLPLKKELRAFGYAALLEGGLRFQFKGKRKEK